MEVEGSLSSFNRTKRENIFLFIFIIILFIFFYNLPLSIPLPHSTISHSRQHTLFSGRLSFLLPWIMGCGCGDGVGDGIGAGFGGGGGEVEWG